MLTGFDRKQKLYTGVRCDKCSAAATLPSLMGEDAARLHLKPLHWYEAYRAGKASHWWCPACSPYAKPRSTSIGPSIAHGMKTRPGWE